MLKLLITLLVLNSLLACSQESLEYSEFNKDYIKFSHSGADIVNDTIDLTSNNSTKKKLVFDNELAMQDLSLSTTFEISANDSLSISTGMTMGFIKLKKNKIELYQCSKNYQTTILNEQFELPDLQEGVKYEIGFRKTMSETFFFLKGNSILFEKKYEIDSNIYQNIMTGKPFFMLDAGNVRVYKSILSSKYNKVPKVSVIGDSFIQGVALNQFGFSLSNRWCVKLANTIGIQNCFIDGQGGIKACKEWLDRLKLECSWFKSKYVILSIGTNNYDNVSQYMSSIKQAISFLKSNGQIPILVTVTPRSTFNYNSTTKNINDWVKKSGEKYVDFHKAVTEENDASKWKEGYVFSDGVHPTVLAYEAMYEQLKKDCPYVFK